MIWKEGHPLPELNEDRDRVKVKGEVRAKTIHNLEGLKHLYQRDDLELENKFWFTNKHRELLPLLNAATKGTRRKQLDLDLSLMTRRSMWLKLLS